MAGNGKLELDMVSKGKLGLENVIWGWKVQVKVR